MIRTPYFAPKVLWFLAIVSVVSCVAGPLAQRILMNSSIAGLGTHLAIESTSVSFFSTDLDLSGVTVANPHHPEQSLLSMQRVQVDVEGTPLLRRKLAVRNARAVGVRLHPTDITPQELEANWPVPMHWKLHLPAQQKMQLALAEVASAINAQPPSISPAIALLEVLSASWPRQVLELQNDIGVYELRAERLAELTAALASPSSDSQQNPEKPAAAQTLLELDALKENVIVFRQRVDELRKSYASDRYRVVSAREGELNRAATTLQLQLPDSEVLTDYFLGQAACQSGWNLLRYLQWAREYLPDSRQTSVAKSEQGLSIAFPERHPLPEFVLRALHFEGTGEVAHESFRFAGTLQNLSSDARALAQPVRLVIDAKVPQRVVIEALFDRTTQIPRDRMVIRCPSWPQPEQMLGNSSQVAIVAQPSLLSLRAELTLTGGNIAGIIQMQQHRLELTPHVADNLGGRRVQASLVDMLAQVETIDYQLAVQGPLDSPAMRLTSPWGQKVAGGLQHAFEKEHSLRVADRVKRTEEEYDQHFTAWERAALAGQQDVQTRLAATLNQVHRLDTLVHQHLPQKSENRAAIALRPQAKNPPPLDKK